MSSSGGDGDGRGDDRGSGLGATLGGALAVIVLVALGVWLVDELAESARYSKCVAARHRNCDAIKYPPPAPQQ